MRDLKGTSSRSYLQLPWGQVHVRSAGDARDPALLMLHQSPLSSATFEAVLAPLAAAGVHVVAMDTPGFGMSDAPPEQWSIPQYADAVWQTADSLGLSGVTLLGQHTGAVVAWEAAVQRPGDVRGLILQGLPLYDENERAEKRRSYAPGYEPAPDGSHLDAIWQRVLGLYPALAVDEADRQVLEYLCIGPDYAPAYRAVFDYQVEPAALQDMAILLLHGDADLVHRFTPAVTAALPWAELQVLAGGTDFAPDELPEQFAAAAARWTRAHVPGTAPHINPKTALHTATVAVQGGRGGQATSRTGSLAVTLARPAERGTDAGTDPEELFAAGYAACFDSALAGAGRRLGIRLAPTTTTASVTLHADDQQSYSISVRLEVRSQECATADLTRAVALADQTCPYSKALRGNVIVDIDVRGRD